MRFVYRVRRTGIVLFHHGDGREDAETEASKTNEREGYAIDSALNLWPGAVGAGRVGTAEAGQDDGVDLCAAGPRSGPCGLPLPPGYDDDATLRSEEHTSELQSLMRISYAVFCLKKKNKQ